jgi:hypothetical protein
VNSRCPRFRTNNRVSLERNLQSNSSRVAHSDSDPIETREWVESLDGVIRESSVERALFLLDELEEQMRTKGLRSSQFDNREIAGGCIEPMGSFTKRRATAYNVYDNEFGYTSCARI